MTEDEVEELQYWCGDAMGHELEEEGHPRKGRVIGLWGVLGGKKDMKRERINDHRGSF